MNENKESKTQDEEKSNFEVAWEAEEKRYNEELKSNGFAPLIYSPKERPNENSFKDDFNPNGPNCELVKRLNAEHVLRLSQIKEQMEQDYYLPHPKWEGDAPKIEAEHVTLDSKENLAQFLDNRLSHLPTTLSFNDYIWNVSVCDIAAETLRNAYRVYTDFLYDAQDSDWPIPQPSECEIKDVSDAETRIRDVIIFLRENSIRSDPQNGTSPLSSEGDCVTDELKDGPTVDGIRLGGTEYQVDTAHRDLVQKLWESPRKRVVLLGLTNSRGNELTKGTAEQWRTRITNALRGSGWFVTFRNEVFELKKNKKLK